MCEAKISTDDESHPHVHSFAEYVPVLCTHRLSNHPSGSQVRLCFRDRVEPEFCKEG